jgi:aryl-alcohol dehydrogenase-like predicted oxidoreductase
MTFGAQADEAASFTILDIAYEHGVRFLDTADVYPIPMSLGTAGETERIVGRWLRDRSVRDEMVLATKAYFPMGRYPHQRGNSRRHLFSACEASLTRLGVECIDLYLCHGWDSSVPVEETLRAFEDLKRAGKVLYTGVSNVRAHELAESGLQAARLGLAGFDGLQHRYNVIQRELEESVLPMARQTGLGVMVYNPLAGGLLSGKYRPGIEPIEGRFTLGDTGRTYRRRYWDEANLEMAAALSAEAEEYGMPLVSAVVAWVLAQPGISSAIIGASRPEQLADNLRAPSLELPDGLRMKLDQAWYDLPRRPPTLENPRLGDFLAEL